MVIATSIQLSEPAAKAWRGSRSGRSSAVAPSEGEDITLSFRSGYVWWTREIELPGFPQIRTRGTAAAGASNHGLASGRQVESNHVNRIQRIPLQDLIARQQLDILIDSAANNTVAQQA